MINNLVIVESPAKAKTIEKILGKDFQVKSSMGHIRDLTKNDISIDIQKNFAPRYVIPPDKKKVVSELKGLVKKSKVVWLASDEDREGEAIAWHLAEELDLNPEKTKRIVFHEITKDAIAEAIENPRSINQDLVNAQQARRVLDRLVGYELSPVLWKKIKPSLSAGRVQSVAVRLIVEREREIIGFKCTSAFKISAVFDGKDNKGKKYQMKAELNDKFSEKKKALDFLNLCKSAVFTVENVVKKPARKSPSPPFTTSTLQQEASRKLGFSVAQTMAVAQRLYEAGKITYMRTDSVNLSNTALEAASELISRTFGSNYVNRKNYKTKSKGAQEAHEAIRPTGLDHETIAGTAAEKKLYELIWKRTVASQMSDAQLEKTTVTIGISNAREKFIAEGEVLKFDGFLKVYFESSDEEPEEDSAGLLPPIEKGMNLIYDNIAAIERFTHYPPRYTEASLVKKMEELGIGRPSTYAPTISTIQQRGYVLKEDRPGRERKYSMLVLKNSTIREETKTENTGAEKNKLFPDNIGMIVNDFLVEYFGNILDFNFTAMVEKEFDEIAAGKLVWHKMIAKFYKPFHERVTNTLAKSAVNKGERKLGSDPETVVQIGEVSGPEKPRYASLRKGQNLESITLEEAFELFKLPRTIGKFEDKDLVVSIGRFGPYILHNSAFYSLNRNTDDPYSINAARAIEIIQEKRVKDQNKVFRTFPEDTELSILNGRWGPYIKYKKENYKIPKTADPGKITYKECLALISNSPARKKGKK
jgi:DNA topoisomerase-1